MIGTATSTAQVLSARESTSNPVPSVVKEYRSRRTQSHIRWRSNNDRSRRLRFASVARAALRGLERHLRDIAPMDPNRRQGSADAKSVDQSLLACDVVCIGQRSYDFAHCLRQSNIPD